MATTGTEQTPVVYWITGCANCTRLKGYLTERGVEFLAIDVQGEVAAFEEMHRAGVQSFPSVRVGDRWVTGFDLRGVDDLLGLEPHDSQALLRLDQLVERAAQFLDTSCRFARQIPVDHLDDPTPTMTRYRAPVSFMPDGSPYVPHHSYRSLVHHIAGHGEKFKRIAMAGDGVHEVACFVNATTGEPVVAFGEPDLATPRYRVIDQMSLTANDIRAWLQAGGVPDMTRTTPTAFAGLQTLHQLLQTMVISLAQHARQLFEILDRRLQIVPNGAITPDLLDGLMLPATVWGE